MTGSKGISHKNISILVDEEPVTEQVVWITGWIINSGSLDIGERTIQHPLKLILPENMAWIRANIDNSSTGIECKCETIVKQEIQFDWTLLRSGEYVHFDALIHCPIEEIQQSWGSRSFVEIITTYSRIENIRSNSVVPISDLGNKYNPLTPREHNITPKAVISVLMALFIGFTWTRAFFPFDLDDFFGDGMLAADRVSSK